MPHRRRPKRDLRPRVVYNEREYYPLVARCDVEAVHFIHKQSRSEIPVPWMRMIEAGAAAADLTPEGFIDHLLEQVLGHSARQSENPDGGASGSSS